MRRDGAVYCWGDNLDGQIGNGESGTGVAVTMPARVEGLPPADEVAAGFAHTCARLRDGSVRCWGYNSSGQIGRAGGSSPSPVAVPGLVGVRALALGWEHSCAIASMGRVYCWGSNALGQLGDNGDMSSSTPVEVLFLTGATSISAGYQHTCVIETGRVSCWGDNRYGQIGNGRSGMGVTEPTFATVALSGATRLGAGSYFTCAVASEETHCWGNNMNGALGDGRGGFGVISPTPVRVVGLGDLVSLAAGGTHGVAVSPVGSVIGWGGNFYGQLGDGSDMNRSRPVLALPPE